MDMERREENPVTFNISGFWEILTWNHYNTFICHLNDSSVKWQDELFMTKKNRLDRAVSI